MKKASKEDARKATLRKLRDQTRVDLAADIWVMWQSSATKMFKLEMEMELELVIHAIGSTVVACLTGGCLLVCIAYFWGSSIVWIFMRQKCQRARESWRKLPLMTGLSMLMCHLGWVNGVFSLHLPLLLSPISPYIKPKQTKTVINQHLTSALTVVFKRWL